MARTSLGTITLDVILRTRADDPIEQIVGEITVPVTASPAGGPHVDPSDIEQALAGLGPDAPTLRTRKGRRNAKRSTRS